MQSTTAWAATAANTGRSSTSTRESFLKSDPHHLGHGDRRLLLSLGVRANRPGWRTPDTRSSGLSSPSIPLVLAVLHIFRLLDAGAGGEPEQLALHDHLLQGYGVIWLVLMGIGLYA